MSLPPEGLFEGLDASQLRVMHLRRNQVLVTDFVGHQDL